MAHHGNATHSSSSNRPTNGNRARRLVKSGQRAAKTIVGRQLDVALTAAGKRLGETATSVRKIGGQLGDGADERFVSDVAQTLAGYVDRLAAYLRDADSETLVSDIEHYGRRYPIVIAGAAFATGFVASRLIKVSSAERLRIAYENHGNHEQE